MGWIIRTIIWGLARRFLGLPGIVLIGGNPPIFNGVHL